MEIYLEDLTLVPAILTSMRVSLDRNVVMERARASLSWVELKKVILKIEEIRISFLPYVKRDYDDKETIKEGVFELIKGLGDLLESAEFSKFSHVSFRLTTPVRKTAFLQNFIEEVTPRATVGKAAFLLYESLLSVNLQEKQAEFDFDTSAIRKMLPPQKIAPVQFDIDNGKIVILRSNNKINEEDAKGIVLGKEAILKQGANLIEMLAKSNCDKRIIEGLENLNRQIANEENIVMIGLSNLTCEMIRGSSEGEMSDVVNSMYQAHTRGVDMYLSQYPDWNRFLENASSARLDTEDIKGIKDSAEFLVNKLERDPSISEPEVPETLKRINELLSNPGGASKRAAFAMMRTIENFVSRAYLYGIELIDQTAKKTIENLSTAISRAAAVGILGLALGVATQMGPATSKIGEMAWLKSASSMVQKQIEKLAN